MKEPSFEIYRDSAGQYRWRLRASNGEIVAEGEAYASPWEVERAIGAVRVAARDAKVLVMA